MNGPPLPAPPFTCETVIFRPCISSPSLAYASCCVLFLRMEGSTDDGPLAVELDHIREIIQRASQHDIDGLRKCIDKYTFTECEPVDVQDPSTGFSPLHAAIQSCQSATISGRPPSEHGPEACHVGTVAGDPEEAACDTVRCLLENGAIWNQLDKHDETPGCIAYRLGLQKAYQLMVDAGVRAELLLNRLDGYEELKDDENDGTSEGDRPGDHLEEDAGVRSATESDISSSRYLSSTLSMNDMRLLDDENNGVMMSWESDIMLRSADAILWQSGLRVLNIGFGMGIIDSHIQAHANQPASHHIVEAHPDVLADMKTKEWDKRPGVVIHAGKWQDVLPDLVAQGELFDAIYFDTFAETYSQFRDFFSEHVIGLLSQNGRWSYFNGMGADRQISYDVYQKVVELDLFESGFDVEWTDLELPKLDKQWEGVRRKYWNVDHYRLPVCKFMN